MSEARQMVLLTEPFILSLPLELADNIVDHLHDDNFTTLLSCSLVSRAFLHSSRYHTFGYLCVSNDSLYDDYYLEKSATALQESVFIRPYVREPEFERNFYDNFHPQIGSAVLASVLKALPKLKRLWLLVSSQKKTTKYLHNTWGASTWSSYLSRASACVLRMAPGGSWVFYRYFRTSESCPWTGCSSHGAGGVMLYQQLGTASRSHHKSVAYLSRQFMDSYRTPSQIPWREPYHRCSGGDRYSVRRR